MQEPLILGFDPGFASLGYAVVRLTRTGPQVALLGVIRTKGSDKKTKVLAADDNVRRAREISRHVHSLFARGTIAAVRPRWECIVHLVCAEKMSFPRNASAAAKMAMTWGLLVNELESNKIPLLQASPKEIKKAVVGDPSASKLAVQEALVRLFGRGLLRMVEHVPNGEREHAFDALAAVVTCLGTDEARMITRLLGIRPFDLRA